MRCCRVCRVRCCWGSVGSVFWLSSLSWSCLVTESECEFGTRTTPPFQTAQARTVASIESDVTLQPSMPQLMGNEMRVRWPRTLESLEFKSGDVISGLEF